MKILLASHLFAPSIGGIESMSLMLADAFVEGGHQVKVITQTPSEIPDSFAYAVLRQPDQRELFESIRWSDVVFHNNISLKALWPVLLLRKPWVVVHQTWIGRTQRSDKLKRFFLRFATQVSISRAVAQTMPGPQTLIGNAYRDQVFRPYDSIPRDRDLVFLGRLVTDKGADLALRALQQLVSSGHPANLAIIGDGPERASLEALAADLGVDHLTVFLGAMQGESLARELNRYRVLLVPSVWAEPFGIVALEGAGCGCIVVGSEKGGLKDAIGPCGITFPNGDVNRFAEAIGLALAPESKDRFSGEESRDHLQRHTIGAIADEYLELFAKVRR